MEPAMSTPEIIPAEVSGYCDLETGECVTAGPVASDGTSESETRHALESNHGPAGNLPGRVAAAPPANG
jgi:hypothetical protein